MAFALGFVSGPIAAQLCESVGRAGAGPCAAAPGQSRPCNGRRDHAAPPPLPLPPLLPLPLLPRLCLPQIDQLLSAREDINASLAGKGKLSVNDFIVKAAALACKKVPAVNASWMGDFVRQFHNVDVNVAVASPAGLMVPFVRDADRKGLLAISEEVKGLAAKVRRGARRGVLGISGGATAWGVG